MSAIQTGSAVCSTVWQGAGSSLPRLLPGLLIATALLSLLLLTAINCAQLITLLQIKKMLKSKKGSKRKEAPKKTSKTIPTKKELTSSDETADFPSGDIPASSDISTITDENRKPYDSCSKNMIKDTQFETIDGNSFQTSQEKNSRSVLSAENDGESVPASDSEKTLLITPTPLYPVKISSSVNYNPLLPVQFQKESEKDAVFTLWSDLTVRPSEVCFLGYNSSAYYSSNRFQNAFDFIDPHGSPVDISKAKSIKLSKVTLYAVVSLHTDGIYLQKKGKIKVEVMK